MVGSYSSEEQDQQCEGCTEGLGFESSDRDVDDHDDSYHHHEMEAETRRRRRTRSRRFPPPISSLSCNGNPVFVLKAVRKDGRLRISREWINRPEILRADSCRENRLRLFVVKADSASDEASEESEQIKGDAAEEEPKRWRLALFQRCHGKQEMSLWNNPCLATT
ncbi:hypothetical protein Sjap_006688 [Stephania japonica]|uniref:FAF domain-containing protein n=1 Tax=Stephania japonica TaxID=461633 RepID=A0AAP0PM71_9MAGN